MRPMYGGYSLQRGRSVQQLHIVVVIGGLPFALDFVGPVRWGGNQDVGLFVSIGGGGRIRLTRFAGSSSPVVSSLCRQSSTD